jgi:putative chitinase
MITSEHLKSLGIDTKWLDPLNMAFEKYGIDTPKRQASFIGQCQHESGNFKHLQENLNYSAPRLMQVFPKRFPTIEIANQAVAKGASGIAEAMYGMRKDLGNTEVGDGGKYFGRGIIQLTGKANYTAYSNAVGKPEILTNPELLALPEDAIMSAGWFWKMRSLNAFADVSDYKEMTHKINGGFLGLIERTANINKALSIIV